MKPLSEISPETIEDILELSRIVCEALRTQRERSDHELKVIIESNEQLHRALERVFGTENKWDAPDDLWEAELAVRDIGRTISPRVPRGWGFLLVLASFGSDGFMTYLSSVERSCAEKLLRELLGKWERGAPFDQGRAP